MSIIELRRIGKTYCLADQKHRVLEDINFSVNAGELVAIMGASGSGKSTLVNLLGLLDQPTEGEYFFQGTEVGHLDDDTRSHLRNKKIGFIFQNFFLLPRLSAWENVALPLLYSDKKYQSENKEHCLALLEKMGLKEKAYHRPQELSGGQQQRVAIARALVSSPTLLLADEPTGALDSQTSKEVLSVFKNLNESEGSTILIVTHDEDVAKQCHRTVRLKDGQIISDY